MLNKTLQKPLRWLRLAQVLLGRLTTLFALFLLLSTFVITLYTVDGHSMEPTLHDRQHIMLFLGAYWLRPPRTGEVVVVAYRGNSTIHFVKRITGQPGDVEVVQGVAQVLGVNQYFVEGDNRDFSTDSRVFGPIQREQIIGKVLGY